LKDTVKLAGLSIDLVRLYEKSFIFRFNIQNGATEDIASRKIDLLIEEENTKTKLGL